MDENVVVAIATCNLQLRQEAGQYHDFRMRRNSAIRRSQVKFGICQDAQQLGGRLTIDDGRNRASRPGTPQPRQTTPKYQSGYNGVGIEYRAQTPVLPFAGSLPCG
jgi:hypothetical protein